jgi:hypothetical protein
MEVFQQSSNSGHCTFRIINFCQVTFFPVEQQISNELLYTIVNVKNIYTIGCVFASCDSDKEGNKEKCEMARLQTNQEDVR